MGSEQYGPTCNQEAGFTLLEVLIVMAIAVASLAVAMEVVSIKNPRRELVQSAVEVAAVMRGAQLAAAQSQRGSIFNFDLKKRQFWSTPDRIHDLDTEIDATMVSVRDPQNTAALAQVRFLSTGQNTGTTIQLKKDNHVVEITADWLTGDIHVRMLP